MNLIHVPRSTQVTAQSSLILMAKRSGSPPVFPWSPSAASGPHSATGNCEAKGLFAHTIHSVPHWILLLAQAFLGSKAQASQLSNSTNLYEDLSILLKVLIWDKKKWQNNFFRIS